MRSYPLLGCMLAAVALAQPGSAQTVTRDSIPAPVGRVNDFAHVIPADIAHQIDSISRAVRDRTAGEIIVVTLPKAGDRPLSETALRIGRGWKIGKKGAVGDPTRNTGLLILLVPRTTSENHKTKLRIETGLGTTTFVTAAIAGRVADSVMRPAFRQGDFGGGLLAGVKAFADLYDHQAAGLASARPTRPVAAAGSENHVGMGFGIAFALIPLGFLGLLIFALFRRRRRYVYIADADLKPQYRTLYGETYRPQPSQTSRPSPYVSRPERDDSLSSAGLGFAAGSLLSSDDDDRTSASFESEPDEPDTNFGGSDDGFAGGGVDREDD